MISVIEQTKTCRAVYFDGFSKISQITNQILDTKDLFAWFEIEDIAPFLDGRYKFSDYIVSRTKNPLIYEIIKSKVDIKRRNKDNQLHKILTIEDADIFLSFEDGELMLSYNKYSISVYTQKYFDKYPWR